MSDYLDRIDNGPRPLEAAINKKRCIQARIDTINEERRQLTIAIAEATMQENSAPTLEQADYWSRQREQIEQKASWKSNELTQAMRELERAAAKVLALTDDLPY